MRGGSLEELASDPVGRYVLGETYVHFCATPALWGVLLWGRPTQEHAVELGKSLVLELAPPARPHASFIDASKLAGGLGVSDRTLQRRLGELALTFQDEMADARVRAAKRRLLETDDAITTIAFEVGCASPQHLNALFKKRAGASPTQWRRKEQGEGSNAKVRPSRRP